MNTTKELDYPSYGKYYDGDTDYKIEINEYTCDKCASIESEDLIVDAGRNGLLCKRCFDILEEEE